MTGPGQWHCVRAVSWQKESLVIGIINENNGLIQGEQNKLKKQPEIHDEK